MEKSLDIKITRILADRSCRDFILADAKDADMAYGLSAPGLSPEQHSGEAKFKSLDQYRQQIREVIAQGLVDIVLMSASSNEVLTIRERLFENSAITPAIRANDATDIWLAGQEGVYGAEPSRPFRSATINHAMCGKAECSPEERKLGADLGLYSVTFNNNMERDYQTLTAYAQFRLEAEKKGFRHFLEVFSPNACGPNCPNDIPKFINDHIARTLAGVVGKSRPVFLKIPYLGPHAMESLASYDSSLVVGILGGSAGTTFDAFKMLADAKKYGARVALYGRKINNAEHQTTFIKYLRAIADEQISPEEAVKAYHADLLRLNIRPKRTLEEDMATTVSTDSYSGKSQAASAAHVNNSACCQGTKADPSQEFDPNPDFANMTQQEKLRWNQQRLTRIFG